MRGIVLWVGSGIQPVGTGWASGPAGLYKETIEFLTNYIQNDNESA